MVAGVVVVVVAGVVVVVVAAVVAAGRMVSKDPWARIIAFWVLVPGVVVVVDALSAAWD